MKDPTWEEEAKTIRRLREAMGLSRSQLAGRLGISAATLKCCECGTQRMGARTFRRLEELVGSADLERTRQSRPDLAVGEAAPAYSVPASEAKSSSHYVHRVIRVALQATSDERARAAATSLADATGIPFDEALAVVIEQRLKNG